MESNGSEDLHTEHYDGFMALPFPANPINKDSSAENKKKPSGSSRAFRHHKLAWARAKFYKMKKALTGSMAFAFNLR